MSWSYAGGGSPWINPTVTPYGTQSFKGETYNRFRIRWSAADPWSGGPDGQVPGGGEFHVGATFSGVDFNQPDPIIITNSELLDEDNDPLPLKPRLPGYDTGTLDSDDGSFDDQLLELRQRVRRDSRTSSYGGSRACCRSTRWCPAATCATRSASRSARSAGRASCSRRAARSAASAACRFASRA